MRAKIDSTFLSFLSPAIHLSTTLIKPSWRKIVGTAPSQLGLSPCFSHSRLFSCWDYMLRLTMGLCIVSDPPFRLQHHSLPSVHLSAYHANPRPPVFLTIIPSIFQVTYQQSPGMSGLYYFALGGTRGCWIRPLDGLRIRTGS